MKKAYNQFGKLVNIIESISEDIYTCPVCKEHLERKFGVSRQYFAHQKGTGEDCEIKMKLVLKEDKIILDSDYDILEKEFYNKTFNNTIIEMSDYLSEEGYYLTQEQKDIIFSKEDKVKISALAGSAKSSTLYYYSKERPFKKILYLVYNRAMKDEAEKSFGKLSNVDIKTIHGLAYSYTGKFYKDKLTFNYGVIDIIKDLHLNYNYDMELAVKINEMMKSYMLSNVKTFSDLEMFKEDKMKNRIISSCEKLWILKKQYKNNIKVEHDFYLKLFQLSGQNLSDKYDIILLDEAQDSNMMMFDIIKNSNVKGVVLVGDQFQCLKEGTLISTPNGNIKIENITVGNNVNVACGFNEKTIGVVESISKKEVNTKMVRIFTETGNIIEGTINHMIFGKIDGYEIGKGKYYVYLMFKKKYGYRIGITSTLRKKNNKNQNGFMARINSERGDKLWIIKVCDTMEDAIYYENFYSFEYGIPQMVFTSDNTKVIAQDTIDKIFKNIDTFSRAEKLFNDLYLFKDYPHHIPQASTGINNERLKISFTMFGSNKISRKTGYNNKKIFYLHPHELSINTTNKDYINCSNKYINMCKKRATSSGNEYFNGRKKHTLYDECWNTLENIIYDMKNIGYDVEPNIKAKLTDDKFDLIPLTNAIEGMIIPIEAEDGIINDKIIKVERFDYKGYVYDINVPYYRNYIANGIVVHNCLYAWRNAVNIMPHFEAKEYFLTTSFRVSQNIANISNFIINDMSLNSIHMKGFNTNQKIIKQIDKNKPYVCLCRTNSYIFAELADQLSLDKDKKLFFEGGYKSYNFENIKDAYWFSLGHKTKNAILSKFDDYFSMSEYAETTEDLELLALIRMVDRYGSKIIHIVDGIKNNVVDTKEKADIIFSTIHRSKGQTYKLPVYISEDHFDLEKIYRKRFVDIEQINLDDIYEEMCIVYVAITRCAGEIQLSDLINKYLLLRHKIKNNYKQ